MHNKIFLYSISLFSPSLFNTRYIFLVLFLQTFLEISSKQRESCNLCTFIRSCLIGFNRGCVPLNARNAHAHNAAITRSSSMSVAIMKWMKQVKSIAILSIKMAEVTIVSVVQILKNYSSNENSSSDEKYESLQELKKETC